MTPLCGLQHCDTHYTFLSCLTRRHAIMIAQRYVLFIVFQFRHKTTAILLLQCKSCYLGTRGCASSNCEHAATTNLSDEEPSVTSLNALGSIRGAASSDNELIYEWQTSNTVTLLTCFVSKSTGPISPVSGIVSSGNVAYWIFRPVSSVSTSV
jgi:hypothetical protein